jgi:acyl carrier protein
MSSREKFDSAFRVAFELSQDEPLQELAYRQHKRWDSVRHMKLIAQLEAAFDIMLDTDDIIDMSSYREAERIVSKHGISIDA